MKKISGAHLCPILKNISASDSYFIFFLLSCDLGPPLLASIGEHVLAPHRKERVREREGGCQLVIVAVLAGRGTQKNDPKNRPLPLHQYITQFITRASTI